MVFVDLTVRTRDASPTLPWRSVRGRVTHDLALDVHAVGGIQAKEEVGTLAGLVLQAAKAQHPPIGRHCRHEESGIGVVVPEDRRPACEFW